MKVLIHTFPQRLYKVIPKKAKPDLNPEIPNSLKTCVVVSNLLTVMKLTNIILHEAVSVSNVYWLILCKQFRSTDRDSKR